MNDQDLNFLEFTNFRRFQNFPKVEFGDITFLVGKNNSGKSTFVKAILLITNYLKSNTVDKLNFNENGVENLNIVTFERALCKSSNEDQIEFKFKLDDLEVHLVITGKTDPSDPLSLSKRKDLSEADVMELSIYDHNSLFSVSLKPQSQEIRISQQGEYMYTIGETNLSLAQKEREAIIKDLTTIKDKLSKEFIELNSTLEKIEKNIKSLLIEEKNDSLNFSVETIYNESNLFEIFNSAETSLQALYHTFNPYLESSQNLDSVVEEDEYLYATAAEDEFLDMVAEPSNDYDINKNSSKSENRNSEEVDTLQNLRYYYQNRNGVSKFFKKIKSFVENHELAYLPASLNKQSPLFSIRDEKNALAQSIHDLYQLDVRNNTVIQGFINKWLVAFEIGDSFDIKSHEGESYEVILQSYGVKLSLADKGMGSIQVALLIFRLATVIYKNESQGKEIIIVIEEPELNLHPALQSKLCDLFYEVFDQYKIRFIIETHSEYLVRKTQLFVKEKDLAILPNENPFSVLYFDKDLEVWAMKYREDGKFSNDFGSGFFDESSNLAFELM